MYFITIEWSSREILIATTLIVRTQWCILLQIDPFDGVGSVTSSFFFETSHRVKFFSDETFESCSWHSHVD